MRKSRGALQETLNAHSAIKVANDQGFDERQEDFADIDEIKEFNEQFDRAYQPCQGCQSLALPNIQVWTGECIVDVSAIAIIKTKRTIQFRPLTWQRG